MDSLHDADNGVVERNMHSGLDATDKVVEVITSQVDGQFTQQQEKYVIGGAYDSCEPRTEALSGAAPFRETGHDMDLPESPFVPLRDADQSLQHHGSGASEPGGRTPTAVGLRQRCWALFGPTEADIARFQPTADRTAHDKCVLGWTALLVVGYLITEFGWCSLTFASKASNGEPEGFLCPPRSREEVANDLQDLIIYGMVAGWFVSAFEPHRFRYIFSRWYFYLLFFSGSPVFAALGLAPGLQNSVCPVRGGTGGHQLLHSPLLLPGEGLGSQQTLVFRSGSR